MVASSEDTRTRLKIIEGHLSLIKKQYNNPDNPVIALLNAAIDALQSSSEKIPLPLQRVLDYLNQISALTEDKASKDLLSQIKQECIQLLIEMFVKNQQRIDSLTGGASKVHEQYHIDFLQSKNLLVQNYHQRQESTSKPASFLDNVIQFLDFRGPLRRAEFLNALHAQTIKYYRQTQVAETSFKSAHLPELMQLEILQRLIQRTLINEPTFDVGMLPPTSRSYQFFMKELVSRYDGIVIGNLSIGKNSYEASREWLAHINQSMKQPLQTYQFINEMDKYTANEQYRFETFQAPVNSMQAQQDRHAAPEAYKQLKTYDQTFINDLLKLLDKSYPSSAIMQFSDNKGNSHSVAIAKDERGIWLHDAHRYCVYFPNKELGSNEATEHFAAFFNDYHQRNFRHLTKVGLVHFPEQKPTYEKDIPFHKQVIAREQPLILGPGPSHPKTALREAQEIQLPEPPKPTRGPKSGL